MATRKPSKHDRLAALLEGRTHVSDADWSPLRDALSPISESYLRKMLRTAGVSLAPLVEGVRQDTLEQLERTLLALRHEYAQARTRERAAACRNRVIAAKEHARWAARKAGDDKKRAEKDEMILWMLTWLENPPLFDAWLRLRKLQHPHWRSVSPYPSV